MRSVKLGITMGDPAGVGCEVALKAVRELREGIIPILIGRVDIIRQAYLPFLSGLELVPFNGQSSREKDTLYYCNVPSVFPIPVPGCGNIETAKESLSYIDESIALWKSGVIDAIVTGPVNKGLIEKSGTPFMGHTEYFADKIGEQNPFMLMFSRDYRVILATTHVSFFSVQSLLTKKRIIDTIMVAGDSLSAIDGRKARIAVCGLDPHCGDAGAIGDFDSTVTAKAISSCVDLGYDVSGPYSSDTIFMKAKWEKFDVVVAMYHDQGLIPFKVIAFDEGVNVTLGLSLVRTSVDHGTAYDIAGKNLAGHGSMLEALNLAASLVMAKIKPDTLK